MFRLSEYETDRIVSRWARCFLGGLALMVLSFAMPPAWPRFGGILGFALFGLGAFSIGLRRWRSEPGLWMLAVLLVVLLTPCYGYFTYREVVNAFFPGPGKQAAGRGWQQISFSIEVPLALHVFWRQVRLAYSVAVLNWKTTGLLRRSRRARERIRRLES